MTGCRSASATTTPWRRWLAIRKRPTVGTTAGASTRSTWWRTARRVPLGVGSNTYTPAYEALVTIRNVKFEFLSLLRHRYELWWSIDERPSRPRLVQRTGHRDRNISVTVPIPRDGHVAWWYVERNPNVTGCPPHRSATCFFDLDTGKHARRRAASPP